MRKYALLMAVLFLSACTQPDGSTALGVPGSPAWMMTASPEAKLATYRANCSGYGYAAGTPEMAQCVQQEAGEYRSNASSAMAALSEGMVQAGQPRPSTHVIETQAPAMTTTNCNAYGDSMRCTTY